MPETPQQEGQRSAAPARLQLSTHLPPTSMPQPRAPQSPKERPRHTQSYLSAGSSLSWPGLWQRALPASGSFLGQGLGPAVRLQAGTRLTGHPPIQDAKLQDDVVKLLGSPLLTCQVTSLPCIRHEDNSSARADPCSVQGAVSWGNEKLWFTALTSLRVVNSPSTAGSDLLVITEHLCIHAAPRASGSGARSLWWDLAR